MASSHRTQTPTRMLAAAVGRLAGACVIAVSASHLCWRAQGQSTEVDVAGWVEWERYFGQAQVVCEAVIGVTSGVETRGAIRTRIKGELYYRGVVRYNIAEVRVTTAQGRTLRELRGRTALLFLRRVGEAEYEILSDDGGVYACGTTGYWKVGGVGGRMRVDRVEGMRKLLCLARNVDDPDRSAQQFVAGGWSVGVAVVWEKGKPDLRIAVRGRWSCEQVQFSATLYDRRGAAVGSAVCRRGGGCGCADGDTCVRVGVMGTSVAPEEWDFISVSCGQLSSGVSLPWELVDRDDPRIVPRDAECPRCGARRIVPAVKDGCWAQAGACLFYGEFMVRRGRDSDEAWGCRACGAFWSDDALYEASRRR